MPLGIIFIAKKTNHKKIQNYFVKKKIDLVILSDGKGRKFKNFLNNRPKSMVSFNKINFLQYLLNLYSKYNPQNIVLK